MPLSKVLWLICLCAYAAEPLRAAVVLSEVMFDPEGDEGTDEFVELYNNSVFPVDLVGYLISDGEGVDTIVSAGMGTLALPQQYILILDPDYISEGSATYDDLVPEDALVVSITGNTFGDRGLANGASEPVEVSDTQGHQIARYEYSVGNPEGYSDEKIRLDRGDEFSNWQDSKSLRGTPGFRNSSAPLDRDLRIRRLSVIPQRPEAGLSYLLTVVVENSGLSELSSPLRLESDSSLSGSWRFVTELNVNALAAGDSAVFEYEFVLPESGIEILRAELLESDDNPENNSATLLVSSEGSGQGLAFNEIQYDPLPGRSEWIELTLSGVLPVSLAGVFISDGLGIPDTARRSPLPELALAPGEFLIIAMDSSIVFDDVAAAAVTVVLDSIVTTLNNGGDSLVLWSSTGEVLARVDYRPAWGNEQSGVSLERISLSAEGNDQANWGACIDLASSTPGRVNSLALPAQHTARALTVFPSPFTPNGDGISDVTEIRYQVGNKGDDVDLRIFDARGRQVRRLAGAGGTPTGAVIWDGRDDRGDLLPTARYIVLLETTGTGGKGVSREKTTVILARPR